MAPLTSSWCSTFSKPEDAETFAELFGGKRLPESGDNPENRRGYCKPNNHGTSGFSVVWTASFVCVLPSHLISMVGGRSSRCGVPASGALITTRSQGPRCPRVVLPHG
jgi:hypothetical protein